MKIRILSATLLASSALSAAVPIDGWYASLFGGYSYIPNNLGVYNSSNYFSRDSFNGGYNAGGRFGYKSNPLRYEGEFTYINAGVSGFQVNHLAQTDVDGQISVPVIMGNIYYDFPGIVQSIEPFLGLGIGYSWVDASFTSQNSQGLIKFNGSNTVFSYQGTAGLTFNYIEYFSVDLAYRYLATNNVGHLGKWFQANLVTVGATYRFDENRYK